MIEKFINYATLNIMPANPEGWYTYTFVVNCKEPKDQSKITISYSDGGSSTDINEIIKKFQELVDKVRTGEM